MSYITSDIKTGSIDQLRNLTPLELKQYDLFYCIEDGKEGLWKVKAGSSETDNLGTVLVCNNGVRLGRIYDYIKPEWFGAVGDGMIDDTQAIQNAINVGNIILFTNIYKISNSLICQNSKHIIGSSQKVIIKSVNSSSIVVVGDDYNMFCIEKITLDGVGIIFGNTHNDFARSASIKSLNIINSTVGVLYKNNCWLTQIIDSQIRNCHTGVKFDFDGAINSGASMVISNTNIYNCADGVLVNRRCLDGFDIKIANTDIEHCDYSIRTVNTQGGSIFCTNVHFELNNLGFIKNEGTDVFISDAWMFDNPNANNYIAHLINLDGTIKMSSSRFSYQDYKFSKITGGSVFVNLDNCVTVGLDENNKPNSTLSTKGVAYKKEKFFENIQVNDNSVVTIEEIPEFDQNKREMNFLLNLNSSAKNPTISIFTNPSGAYGKAFVFNTPMSKIKVSIRIIQQRCYYEIAGILSDGSTVNKYDQIETSHADSIRRFVDIKLENSDGGVISNLISTIN